MGAFRSDILDELHPLDVLRRECGEDVADRFHDAFAGQNIYVPMKIDVDHPIAAAIGLDAATALVAACGGVKFEVPTNRQRRIRALFAKGASINEIATELAITHRGVRRQLRQLGLIRNHPRGLKSRNGEQ